MTLAEQVKKVAELRENVAFLKAAKAGAYQQWQIANKELLETLDKESQALEAAEIVLKTQALEQFSVDNNPRPVLGIQIKHFTRLVYQENKALDWAIEHHIALALDKHTFETIAKMTPPDFVTILMEPRVQIATDLREKGK